LLGASDEVNSALAALVPEALLRADDYAMTNLGFDY
jgi:hypothetical protein